MDSGSRATIVRESSLPKGARVERYPAARALPTAGPQRLLVVGTIILEIDIGDKRICTATLVAPRLPRPLVIGSGAMQEWGISIVNRGRGRETEVRVRLDARSREATEVL